MRSRQPHPGTVEPLEARAYLASAGADFREPRPFTSGDGPAYVATADFNGDGKLDVATLNVKEGTVAVLEGDGRGKVGSHRAIPPVGTSPRSFAVADFNGDSRLDALTTLAATSAVAVQLGTGTGTFQHPPLLSTYGPAPAGADVPAVAVADFNGDGRLDVAVTCPAGDALSILHGNGDGTFQHAHNIPLGAPTAVAAGDFNGDGKPDLIAASAATGELIVFVGSPDPAHPFLPGQVTALPGVTGLKTADVNGDARPDVLATAGAAVAVLVSNGNATFQAPRMAAVPEAAADVVAADFNGDGRIDLAVANAAGPTARWLAGNGDGTFDTPAPLALGAPSGTLAAADLDANGKPDLVFGHPDGNTITLVLNGERPTGGGGPKPGPQPVPEPIDPVVDLVPVLSARLPAAAVAGRKAKGKGRLVLTLFNDGNVTAAGPVTIDVFASPDTTLDPGDTPVATATRKLKVKAGKRKVIRLKFRAFPAALPGGSYRVLARVGLAPTIETDTSNNVAASQGMIVVQAAAP